MFCPKCGNKVKDDSKFCHQCGTKISNQETTSNTQNIRKDTLYLATEYNNAYFAVHAAPLVKLICIILLIVAILLFMVLPKVIGIIILVAAVIGLVRESTEISNIRNRLNDLERELKSRRNIINDMITDPAIELDKNEYEQLISSTKRGRTTTFVVFALLLTLINIMLIMCIVLNPMTWEYITLVVGLIITGFLIYKAVKSIKYKGQIQLVQKIRDDGMMEMSSFQLSEIKRCNERLNTGM